MKPYVGQIVRDDTNRTGTVKSLHAEDPDWGGDFAIVEYVFEDVFAPVDQRPARSLLESRWHYTEAATDAQRNAWKS